MSSPIELSEKSECVDTVNCPNRYVSKIEEAILQSEEPLDLECTDEISTGEGLSFVLANKSEISNWIGPLPITDYPINEDASPIVINKYAKCIECKQDVLVKYLEPPALPQPGRIVVNQQVNIRPPEAPPIIIRQEPPVPVTPPPLIIREQPPIPPPIPAVKVITIPGKIIRPPRQVIYIAPEVVCCRPKFVSVERCLCLNQVRPPQQILVNLGLNMPKIKPYFNSMPVPGLKRV